MRKFIEIDGKEFEIAANGATPIRFKQLFGKDLFKSLQDEGESAEAIETVMQLCFVMSKQAERANFNSLKYDNFIDWLEEFEPMAFITNAETILSAYMENQKTDSVSKKK